MADAPAWLPGPLEDDPLQGGDNSKPWRPGLKRRFSESTFTDSDERPEQFISSPNGSTASMSMDTEKRRSPQGRRGYQTNPTNYHQWETETGNPFAGTRRPGPTK